jgi:hypothetical protein
MKKNVLGEIVISVVLVVVTAVTIVNVSLSLSSQKNNFSYVVLTNMEALATEPDEPPKRLSLCKTEIKSFSYEGGTKKIYSCPDGSNNMCSKGEEVIINGQTQPGSSVCNITCNNR